MSITTNRIAKVNTDGRGQLFGPQSEADGQPMARVLAALGIPLQPANSGQFIGDCVFCGKPGHFYVGPRGADCKRCGWRGNVLQFVREFYQGLPQPTTADLQQIVKARRGVAPAVAYGDAGFRRVDAERWALPIFNPDGALVSLRTWRPGEHFQNLPGQPALLWGWGKDPKPPYYLCEGEWDGIALRYHLAKAKLPGTVLAVPGATTFKPEWAKLLSGEVNLLYDCDDAGRKGMARAADLLAKAGCTVRTIRWPAGTPEGFDVSDWLREHRRNGVRRLLNLLGENPQSPVSPKGPVKPMPLDKALRVFQRWLGPALLPTVEVVLGVVASSELPGDPAWLFLVGAPGSGKTEILQSLFDLPQVVAASQFTPQSLISGWGIATGEDSSLLKDLHRRTLVVKDFTTLLNIRREDRAAIFGTLRDCFDGQATKAFGVGGRRTYTATFNVLAAVTPAIEQCRAAEDVLGQRFLHWLVPTESPEAQADRALGHQAGEAEMRRELTHAAEAALAGCSARAPRLPATLARAAKDAALFLRLARCPVPRDGFTRQVEGVIAPEGPARIAKSLSKVARGLLALGSPMARIKRHLDAIVWASVPDARRLVLHQLFLGGSLGPKAIRSSYSTSHIARTIGDLHLVGLLDIVTKDERERSYRLKANVRKYLARLFAHNSDLSPRAASYRTK